MALDVSAVSRHGTVLAVLLFCDGKHFYGPVFHFLLSVTGSKMLVFSVTHERIMMTMILGLALLI